MNALHWFEGYGIELEWMLVDRVTLEVRPIADQVLEELAGEAAMEVALGPVAWSNELALHVVELKTNGPARDLDQAERELASATKELDARLAKRGATLLPTGMHPFMNPEREFRLWPTDEERIYGTFDRIFDCRGHGWSNLQSMHINLPFADDREFAALHDAIRALLPLMPALAASSPFIERKRARHLDERVAVYRGNAARIFEVSGHVVPPRVRSRDEYQQKVLEPIYQALAPYDPEGVLRHEWVNARGAIARFDRMAIEIRILDTQECVRTNLALAHGLVELLRSLVFETERSLAYEGSEPELLEILERTARDGDRALINNNSYLAALAIDEARISAREIWQTLFSRVPKARRSPVLWPVLETVVNNGCLSRRILEAASDTPSEKRLLEVYSELSRCLIENRSFVP